MARQIDLTTATTEELQEILRKDAQNLDQDPDMEFLTPIVEELTRRRKAECPEFMTTEQAFEQFNRHYRPQDPENMIDPGTGIELTPSPAGRDCLGNGEHPGMECCCDECNDYLTCFPGWFPGATWDVDQEKWV